MQKFILIIGPQAVGKMTVGKEIAQHAGYDMFHNHVTIDPIHQYFSYGTDVGRKLVRDFRELMFKAFATSKKPGLIFTYVWDFDDESNHDYVEYLKRLFTNENWEFCIVELETTVEKRLERNVLPDRLEAKPFKKDTEWTTNELLSSVEKHRLNSQEGEITHPNYLRIDNTELSPGETALKIINHFKI